MKKYTNTSLILAAVIGLSASSSAFADTIHGALENNRASNEVVEANVIAVKHDSTPWTLQELVDSEQAANATVETNVIAVKYDSSPWTLQDLVDNEQAAFEATVASL